MARQYYVYMMTNPRRTALYTGVTNDLLRRVWQHRNGAGGGFTKRYHCSQIVLYEVFMDSYNAIAREKQIKAGPRRRKVELIERMNPEWRDLYDELWGCTRGIASDLPGPLNDCVGGSRWIASGASSPRNDSDL